MNRLLLFTLLLVACKQKPIEQLPTTAEKEVVVRDTITVSDIHRKAISFELKRGHIRREFTARIIGLVYQPIGV